MRLTVQSDYALRVLMYLGIHAGRLATIEEIARAYGISQNHLMKIVNRLATHGFVETVRGRGGGLRLAKPTESIGLGEVVRRTEPDFAIVSCFKPIEEPCAIRPCCVLKNAFEKARDAFIEVLDGYTLKDLIEPRGRLIRLLDIRQGTAATP
jgi:Rrf2 family nitric oxide-sensitive transcriptional repressor